jgi:hypothetical protein
MRYSPQILNTFFILFIISQLCSCSTRNPEKEVVQAVSDFLNWYNNQYKQVNAFGLVNQSDSAFYSVNFEETEKYLTFLKQSGYVSEKYLKSFRDYFQNADQDFKNDPVNEGPPAGFDYDIILYTQEPEIVFENRHQPEAYVISVNQDHATVQYLAGGFGLQFTLSQYHQQWLIDAIKPLNEN